MEDLIQNRVLVVDDNPFIRQSLRTRLEQAGADVVEAKDGVEGIDTASHCRPHVIILDFEMPRMNGLEAAPRLKQMFPKSFIILFTLHAREIVEAKAQQAGVTAVVSKDRAGIDLLPLARILLSAN
jgi:CheY-like chemotaxis protein